MFVIKGAVIGAAFILPGTSGSAVAVSMGLFERLVFFLADMRKNFWGNVVFFMPVGVGVFLGLFITSVGLDLAFGVAEPQLLSFFAGCILATLPGLWREAGREGKRRLRDYGAVVLGILIMVIAWQAGDGGVQDQMNAGSWLLVGAIVALGVMMPGLSTATLLIVLGLYQNFTSAVATMDIVSLMIVGVGSVVGLLALSKGTAWLFRRAYAPTMHGICGLVFASVVSIIPTPPQGYFGVGVLVMVGLFVLGMLFGRWLSNL